MRADTFPQNGEDDGVELAGRREALLACTSDLRLGLLAEGDVVAASVASVERLRGVIDGLSLPGLHRCAESLSRWLESPGGLARRAGGGFAEVARDVVGLVEQCVDAVLVEAPVPQIDTLLERLQARCTVDAADDAMASESGAGLLESFADDALDELDRCEDLLLRAEIEGATREGLEALRMELVALLAAGQELRVEGLDACRVADRLTSVGAAASLEAMIDELLGCVDEMRCAVEVACEADGSALAASIPLSELLKRLRRGCRDRARALGGRIRVETDCEGTARVKRAAAVNSYEPLVRFAGQAVAASLQHAEGSRAAQLRIRAGIGADRVQIEIEDDTVDEIAAGEIIQALDARFPVEAGALHSYRRGYANIVQVLVDD